MRAYDATATIAADPSTIWAILTDAGRYSDWDSGVVRIEGRIAPGEKVKVVSEANPGRAFPVKVTQFEPGRSMTWSGGMPLGPVQGRPHLHVGRAVGRGHEVHESERSTRERCCP